MTLIPGDGIGPEVAAAARLAVEATGVGIEWDVQLAGAGAVATGLGPLPERTLASVRERGVALKGPVATAAGAGTRSVNLTLRDALELHTGIRPCRLLRGAPSPLQDFDVVVTRMLHGDLYAGIEFTAGSTGAQELRRVIADAGGVELPEDAGISVKPISLRRVEQAARAAFAWARANGRRRVTIAHKATVMRATDGVFLEAARAVAEREFPELAVDDRLIDTLCHDLVARGPGPTVLFAPMLYGDVLSDLCAGLTGGLGLAPGANLGDRCAVFEPVHGTAPRLDNGRSNPMAMIRSAAMMLRHLEEKEAADALERAVAEVVAAGRCVTYDVRPGRDPDGAAGTEEVAEAVAGRLRA